MLNLYSPTIQYCTGWFDRINLLIINWDWGTCCYQHDLDYANLANKLGADWRLATCVEQVTGPLGFGIAMLMFLAVSTIGWLFYMRAALRKKESK